MKMCLDHDRLFQPSKPTFFSYENSQIKETGRKYKLATWHAVPNKEFPAAFLLDASGYPWSVGTVYFLNDCCRTNFFWIGWTWRLLRLLNNQTHCHLFFSGWKNIVLSGVSLSFKQLKWRKVSLLYLWLNVYLVVSINRHSLNKYIYYIYIINIFFWRGGLQSPEGGV